MCAARKMPKPSHVTQGNLPISDIFWRHLSAATHRIPIENMNLTRRHLFASRSFNSELHATDGKSPVVMAVAAGTSESRRDHECCRSRCIVIVLYPSMLSMLGIQTTLTRVRAGFGRVARIDATTPG